MGISTAGYRANKYTPDDWHNTNYARYYQVNIENVDNPDFNLFAHKLKDD